MKAAIICIIGLMGSWCPSRAEPLVEGQVRLSSGAPVPGAQVLLFGLADLRAPPLAATTDRFGQFTLPLGNLGEALPERFELGANYPNPFNSSTMIPYQLPASMHVRLEVFNIVGQCIATLVDGERPAGFHTAHWDATDAAGKAVAAGGLRLPAQRRRRAGHPVVVAYRRTGGDSIERAGRAGYRGRGGRGDGLGLRVDRLGPGAGPLCEPGLPGRDGQGFAGPGGRSSGHCPAGEGVLLRGDPRRRGQLGGCRFLRRPPGGPVQPAGLHRPCPTTAISPWGTSMPTGKSICPTPG